MNLWMQIAIGVIPAIIVLTGGVIVLAALGKAQTNHEEAERMERLKDTRSSCSSSEARSLTGFLLPMFLLCVLDFERSANRVPMLANVFASE